MTIDNDWAAFLLIEILYEKGLINKETYNNVQKSVNEKKTRLNTIGSNAEE